MSTAYQQQGHPAPYDQYESYFLQPAFPSQSTAPAANHNPQYAQREKERAKAIARVRQYAIAEGMSRDVSDEYQDDILYHMMTMDVSCVWRLDNREQRLLIVLVTDRDIARS